MSAKPIFTVFVIDDDSAFADSMSHLLEAHGFSTRTFPDAEDFLAQRGETPRPAIALVDVRMPRKSGLDLLTEIQDDPLIIVVMMTGHGDVPLAVRAIQRGAIEFIEKPFPEEKLLSAIEVASEELDRRLATSSKERNQAERLAQLSPREMDVLKLVAEGLHSKRIADRLGLSVRTVEMHRANVVRRLGIRSMAEALTVFLQSAEGSR